MNQENKKTEWKPVNMWIAAPIIMQIAIAGMLFWGFFGQKTSWDMSWLCPYTGVILCLELSMYNGVVKKGRHPVKSLYPIVIMLGFAFFFTLGFAADGWSYSWIALAAAAVGVGVVCLTDKAVAPKK